MLCHGEQLTEDASGVSNVLPFADLLHFVPVLLSDKPCPAPWHMQCCLFSGQLKIDIVVCCYTGVLFFALVLGSAPLTPWLATLGLTPLMAAVLVGGAQNVFSKSAKYSLFDPCKEMAYIPLDQETQLKGKAAIDVVCNPLGKSGGALIQQAMIVGFGSLAASTPYLGVILGIIVFAWIKAAASLSTQFAALEIKEQRAKLAEEGLKPGQKYKFESKVNEQVWSQYALSFHEVLYYLFQSPRGQSIF